MAFNNPIIGSGGTLIRQNIKSDNYVPGVSGWQITRDGDAEFSGVVVRGLIEYAPPGGGGNENGVYNATIRQRDSGDLGQFDTTAPPETVMSAMTFAAQEFQADYHYMANYQFEVTSTVAGDRARFRVRKDDETGTILGGCIKRINVANLFESVMVKAIWQQPSTATEAVVVTIDRFSGTGTVTGRISATDTYGQIQLSMADVP
jgi:hypothetical protein